MLKKHVPMALTNFKIMKHTYKNSFYKWVFKHCSFCFIILIIGTLCLQNVNAQDFCSTETFSDNSSFEFDVQSANAVGPYSLKIYVHVIRNSMGIGGQSDHDVQDALAILHQDFNPHDIFFIWDCEIDYIDDDNWFVGPLSNPTGIYSINNHYDGIDIYLFPATANSPGGKANGVGSSSEFWVSGTWPINDLPVAQTRIISHEMGHVINLWHTHHGCESGNWELTNGSNCATAGDFVCDTPADPHMQFYVDATTCEWNGTAHPYCAGAAPEPLSSYTPDTNVIMAYTAPECMAYFTSEQGDRMRNSIATLPYLQATLTTDLEGNCDCESTLTINNTFNTGDDEYFEVSNWITSTATVNSGANVTYDAGNYIHLNPGFIAKNGSTFLGKIDGCSASSDSDSEESTENKADESNDEVAFKNYPNPFTGHTTIEFTLLKDAPVTLLVSDVTGKQIAVLLDNEQKTQGTHLTAFDGSKYAAGMYYYTIQVGEYTGTQKMILIK